jgi:hypothetical protein
MDVVRCSNLRAMFVGFSQVLAIQAELERLSCSYAAKLAAEQAERQRLSAEAAQARLLCTARGRQVSSLQQELQQLRDAAAQQQQTAAASTSVQQQQLESLRERLQDSQRQLAAAQQGAAEAQAAAAAAEGGKAGLREQVEELQALLSERQLQVEWLEAKVADVEGSDISQQVGAGAGCEGRGRERGGEGGGDAEGARQDSRGVGGVKGVPCWSEMLRNLKVDDVRVGCSLRAWPCTAPALHCVMASLDNC